MLAACRVYDYVLPLARPLPGTGEGERAGLLLCLEAAGGERALGDCAPLPGFSTESLSEAREQLARFAAAMAGRPVPPALEVLDGGFEAWLGPAGYAPAVRFAIEAAVLDLLAARRGRSLARLLTPSPPPAITVAGLVDRGEREAVTAARELVARGHRVIKLKVGGDPALEAARVDAVRMAMGRGTRLRLDANRSWPADGARFFLASLAAGADPAAAAVEYVEEPARTLAELRTLDGAGGPPLALDEGLRELEPKDLDALPGLGAVVLKPTLLGLERAATFARAARARGTPVVVSSSFESGVGTRTLAQLAAAWAGPATPAGLGTREWLADDLLAAPATAGPAAMVVDGGPPSPRDLRQARLRCTGAAAPATTAVP